MRRCPQSKNNANKREKHLNRKRGVWRGPLEVCEKGVAKKTKKKRKLSAPQRQGHFCQRHQTRQKYSRARAPTARQICARAPDTTQKNTSQNDLGWVGSAAPMVLTSKSNFVKISNFSKYKIVTRRKIILKYGPQNRGFLKQRKGEEERRKSVRNPLFRSVSRVSTSSTFVRRARRAPTKKNPQRRVAKKVRKRPWKWHFSEKADVANFWTYAIFREKTRTPFRASKHCGFRRPGPLINSSWPAY